MNQESGSLVPDWKGEVEGWTVNFAGRNVWRLAPDYDIDDIVQEAFIKYLHCSKKYAGAVQSAKHFMSLYKTAVQNMTTNLALRRSKLKTVPVTGEDSEEDFFDNIQDHRERERLVDVETRLLLESCPQELLPVVRATHCDDSFQRKGARRETTKERAQRLLTWHQTRPRFQRDYLGTGKRPTTNEYLCGILGVDPQDVDLRTPLRNWLG